MVGDAAGAHRCADLFAEIWTVAAPRFPISAHIIRALAYTGNYVAAAWIGDDLVGASVGFLGLDDGRIFLHSDITGVTRWAQGRGVGFALKQHQRAWALERGIDRIGWTFDPLIRSNARFNLVKLGAVAVGYRPDFYGRMDDGINAGDRSDRCTVRWHLRSPGVVAASEGRPSEPDPVDGLVMLDEDADGGPMVELDQGGRPRTAPLRCYVPPDIVKMRAADPGRARAWRQALADTMGAAMATGYVAGAITLDGWYVLTRPESEDRPDP